MSVHELQQTDFLTEAELLSGTVPLPERPCDINDENGLAYYGRDDVEVITKSRAAMIICKKSLKQQLTNKSKEIPKVVLADNPLLSFCQVASHEYKDQIQPQGLWKHNPDGSHPRNVIIREGAIVYDNVWLGDNCVIGANCVIGDAGFGFARDEDGSFVSMPHFGGVRIGNNVEIGPGCIIDCGTFGNTIIEDNVRIDNLTQIAHNVTIGTGTRIMASVSISGSVRVGRDCWISPKSMIRNGHTIGDSVLIGCSSMVTTDIPSDHIYKPRYRDLHLLVPDEDWAKR